MSTSLNGTPTIVAHVQVENPIDHPNLEEGESFGTYNGTNEGNDILNKKDLNYTQPSVTDATLTPVEPVQGGNQTFATHTLREYEDYEKPPRYQSSKRTQALSILNSVFFVLFILFLIVFTFLLILPTSTLLRLFYTFQLNFTDISFEKVFQQSNNSTIDGLSFNDTGIYPLIRTGLFGYCVGEYNSNGDFNSAQCQKTALNSLDYKTILFNQIQSRGSTETKVLVAQYDITLPDVLSKSYTWQPKGAEVSYILILVFAFVSLFIFLAGLITEIAKPNTRISVLLSFKTLIIWFTVLSGLSFILFLLASSFITSYVNNKLFKGLSQSGFNIKGTRSHLFYIFTWLGYGVSYAVLISALVIFFLYARHRRN
ncbi:hypothetical protein WICMUC_002811 [Wickerhamomyces mucosus]|uniref:Uncharacterized protein n=1 Tax=Wickerhamomyces mucosus TaxID=1378264 RepID=A0A9P8TE15_9ASCO|nr:hypothetical protein WICMUC_002811 [Wickerhamomyces mucosus]